MKPSLAPAREHQAISEPEAHVVEIFSSVQGEGPHLGRRQIFVRFAGCNIRCSYCDTPVSLAACPFARIEQTPMRCNFQTLANPLSLRTITQAVKALAAAPHHAVSLTGGEPLLHVRMLKCLLPHIRSLGLKSYLETNGTLPDALADVIQYLDIVSMDLKMPQTLTTSRDYLPEHAAFLDVAVASEVFVKVVLPEKADIDWLDRAAAAVAARSRSIPFVIQPVTPLGGCCAAPSASEVLAALDVASAHLRDVRVIGQMHRSLGLP